MELGGVRENLLARVTSTLSLINTDFDKNAFTK